MTDDRQSMLNSLQYSRNHVLGILEGMTDEQLKDESITLLTAGTLLS